MLGSVLTVIENGPGIRHEQISSCLPNYKFIVKF